MGLARRLGEKYRINRRAGKKIRMLRIVEMSWYTGYSLPAITMKYPQRTFMNGGRAGSL